MKLLALKLFGDIKTLHLITNLLLLADDCLYSVYVPVMLVAVFSFLMFFNYFLRHYLA